LLLSWLFFLQFFGFAVAVEDVSLLSEKRRINQYSFKFSEPIEEIGPNPPTPTLPGATFPKPLFFNVSI